MRQGFYATILSLFCIYTGLAQYGNAWIDFDKTYYKFKVAEDGIYRIPQAVLSNAGLGNIPGSQFRLYLLGEEIAIYTTTEGVFSASDFVEFYGVRNRGEFDRMLYKDPDAEQLNPQYSMFTDSSTYFLTWDADGQGKRLMGIANDLSNPPSPEAYYMHQDEWVYFQRSIDPRNAVGIAPVSLSRFQEGEGYGRPEDSSFVLEIPSTLIVTSGPDATLDVRFASSTFTQHDITLLVEGDSILATGTMNGFHLLQATTSVPASKLGANTILDIQEHVQNGRFSVSYVLWRYPRQYDFTDRSFAIFRHQSIGSAQYFELTNFDHGNTDPIIYDKASGVRLIGTRNGNAIRFLLPAYSGEHDIVIASEVDQIHSVDVLSPRTFEDYSGDNTEYVIITHSSLRSGTDIVSQYAQYRSSAIGGGYDVNIYNILDLYDQFGYGIEKHPQAIRNFTKMIREQWSAAKMALIIGKGIVYPISRTHGSETEQHLLVPTFGSPGADHLLFTDNGISLPPFPVGRLPVSDPAQLQAYLSKVIEYDQVTSLPQTLEDKGWTKHILHMGGGADASQQAQILDFLDQMAENAVNSPFGAYVTTFTKNSTNATGQSNSDLILDILHDGVSIAKFFGHSSATTLDFQINNPRDWKNKGKYPIFSAMGCSSGDIHKDFLSLSENFVFEPDAGTIAFVAGSGSQYLNTLGGWGEDWYYTFGYGVNTLTLGETILESLSSLNQFGTLSSILLIEQQTLTGDPAIRFYSGPGPDYLWDYQSVKFTPELLTTNDESFTLSADVVNIGTNFPDTVLARVMQKLPDGNEQEVFFDTVNLNGFRSSLSFTIPIERSHNGLNTFYLTIDALDSTDELPAPAAEENNELVDDNGKKGIDIFILDNRARTTYPQEFSIVTDQNPVLIGSSTNAFIKGQTFVMEIDTTLAFNSSLRVREYFNQFGGMIKWTPQMDFIPGTVYYWRVSIDSLSPAHSYVWDESSFLYNPGGQRGWNQSHYYQFLRDDFDGMRVNDQRRFEFQEGVQNVWVQNAVDTGETERFKFFIDNENFISFYRPWKPYEAHVFVVVFDPVTGEQMKNPIGGAFGAINPFDKQRPVFPFSTSTPESRNALMTFIEDVVPSDHYIVLFTYQRAGFLDYYPESWAADSITYGRNLFSVIENIYPESNIRTLQNGSVPYTLFFQKDVGPIQEQIAIDFDATINVDANFSVMNTSGFMTSTLVGPASTWSRVEWSFSEKEIQDSIFLSVYAVRQDNTETLIADHSEASDIDISWLDANEYPFLRLQLHVMDTSESRTTPQLEFWRVLFEGRPEFVFNPTGGFEFHYDSLRFGENLHFKTVVENVSPHTADAVGVSYTITDELNNVIRLDDTIPPLAPGQNAQIEFTWPAMDHPGDHFFLAELNPGSTASEIYHYNNFGARKFYVIPDNATPLLDVTFDGRHLEDGDVISEQPEIIVTLIDDNPFMPILDKDHFELFIQTPQSFEFEEVDLASPEIQFIPSDTNAPITTASITWHPVFEEEGIYTFKATAKDGSDNTLVVPYEINFEILEAVRIVGLRVIPNPFYDEIRFSFTLTGSASPELFKIYITDVTGKSVRVLDEEELGIVHVGTHAIDITWDGRGEGGSLVPAGMYFYRVEARDQAGHEFLFDRLNGDVGKIIFMR